MVVHIGTEPPAVYGLVKEPPMSLPSEQGATYEDLLSVPPHLVAEIINGRLVTHPRPAPKHAWAASRMGGRLDSPFIGGNGGPGGWIILDEPELHLGDHVLVPDLAGWRRERMPSLPETAWIELVPNWVCEVLSPSRARLDRAEKMPIYAGLGVAHRWLVDPDAQTLEVYARQPDGRRLLLATLKEADEVRQQPFDAVAFSLAALWPPQPETTTGVPAAP
jgi:Uma2 family endonuclease